MSRYSKGNARRSIIDTAVFRVASQAATMLSYILLVRGLAESEFGVISLLYAFIPVVSTLASLGLEQTLRRFQPEFLQAERPGLAYWLFRTVASARLATSVLFLGAVLLGWSAIAPLFKLEGLRLEFLLFCVPVVVHLQLTILQLSLASHMRHRYSVGAMAMLSILKCAAYGALIGVGDMTLRNVIFADATTYLITFGVMAWAHQRYCSSPLRDRPDAQQKRRMLRYGLFNNFNEAGTLALNNKVDNFYIAAFIDAFAVGVYSFYTRLNEMLANLLPVKLFENVVHPILFSMPKADAGERMPRYFSLLLDLNFMLQWPILALTLCYHGEIVQVAFGGKFIEHSSLLPVIVALASVSVVAVPVTMVAQYEEKAGIILMSKILAVANIGFLILAVPRFGILGAAVATGTSGALKNLFIWWNVRDRARWINAGPALLSAALVWGGTVALCLLLKRFVPLPPVVHLLLGTTLTGVVALAHLRGGALSSSDREIIAQLAKGNEARLLRKVGIIRPLPGGT